MMCPKHNSPVYIVNTHRVTLENISAKMKDTKVRIAISMSVCVWDIRKKRTSVL